MQTINNLKNEVLDKEIPLNLQWRIAESLEILLNMSNSESSTCCATGTCS